MKRVVLSLFLLVGMVSFSHAQTYRQALGIRSGFGGQSIATISYNLMLNETNGLELMAGYYGVNGKFAVGLMYKKYAPVRDSEYFQWYWGAAPMVYISPKLGFAAVGSLGIEYVFENIPLSIAGDFLPTLSISPKFDIDINAGVALRYIIN